MATALQSSQPIFRPKVTGVNADGELIEEYAARGWPWSPSVTATTIDKVKATLADVGLQYCQSVWIDNSAGASDFILTFGGLRQKIVAKAKSQGFYRVLCSPMELDVEASSSGTLTPAVVFLNVEIPPAVWFAT